MADSAQHPDDPELALLVPLALTSEQRIARAVAALPTLSPESVARDDACPICLLPFASILAGENVAPHDPPERAGVTRLPGCGHVFCRLDVIEWIRGRHGTCPACRHTFLDVRPPSESDGESSDGDYIPADDDLDEDEELDFTDDDGSDFDVEPLEDAAMLGRENEASENWGLSDGDSLSEGELAVSVDEALEGDAMADADVRVHDGDEEDSGMDEAK